VLKLHSRKGSNTSRADTQGIALPPADTYLEAEAAKRSLTVRGLVERIMDVVRRDKMVGAILDDADDHKVITQGAIQRATQTAARTPAPATPSQRDLTPSQRDLPPSLRDSLREADRHQSKRELNEMLRAAVENTARMPRSE